MKEILILTLIIICSACSKKEYSLKSTEKCTDLPHENIDEGVWYNIDTINNIIFNDSMFQMGYSDSLSINFFKSKEVLLFENSGEQFFRILLQDGLKSYVIEQDSSKGYKILKIFDYENCIYKTMAYDPIGNVSYLFYCDYTKENECYQLTYARNGELKYETRFIPLSKTKYKIEDLRSDFRLGIEKHIIPIISKDYYENYSITGRDTIMETNLPIENYIKRK